MPISLLVPQIPIWRSFELPEIRDYPHFLTKKSAGRIKVNANAAHVLKNTSWSIPLGEVRFVRATVNDFGAGRMPVSDFCAALQSMDIRGFSATTAAALRFAYKDQPLGERLRVILDPEFVIDAEVMNFLDLVHDVKKGLCIEGHQVSPAAILPPKPMLVLRWVEGRG